VSALRTRLLRALPALASFAIPLVVYLAGFRYVGSGDTRPAELLPIALLRGRGFDLTGLIDPAEKYPYWYHRVGDRLVSSYPILPGLLNVPAFAVARAAGVDLEANRERLSLITASLLCAASAFFLFQALVLISSRRRDAFGLTLLYAFGTCVWSVASRAMWQHGPSVFLLTGALWLLLRGDRASAAASGLLLSLAVVNRPPNVLVAAPLVLFVLRRRREALPLFAALAGVPLLLHAAYASVYLGSPVSTGYWNPIPEVANFRGNPFVGFAGLLVSPSRGLFVFDPFFLFAIAGALSPSDSRGSGPSRRTWRRLVAAHPPLCEVEHLVGRSYVWLPLPDRSDSRTDGAGRDRVGSGPNADWVDDRVLGLLRVVAVRAGAGSPIPAERLQSANGSGSFDSLERRDSEIAMSTRKALAELGARRSR
jgi:hypothetical protein